MQNEFSEAQRLSHLEERIDILYGQGDPLEKDNLQSQYEEEIFEMFEVCNITENGVELMPLFNNDIFTPVHVHESIRSLLRKKDVFLMQLERKKGLWHVSYMSPPYDTVDTSREEGVNDIVG